MEDEKVINLIVYMKSPVQNRTALIIVKLSTTFRKQHCDFCGNMERKIISFLR
jgi:hypothetical protein